MIIFLFFVTEEDLSFCQGIALVSVPIKSILLSEEYFLLMEGIGRPAEKLLFLSPDPADSVTLIEWEFFDKRLSMRLFGREILRASISIFLSSLFNSELLALLSSLSLNRSFSADFAFSSC